jgi:hypothetical protein
MPRNQQILLASRPQGEATVENFRLVATDTPALQDGQVLVRHHYLSLDPYMRGRMNDEQELRRRRSRWTRVMIGGTVGEVVESRATRQVRRGRQGGGHGWLAAVQRGRCRHARPAAQGGHHPCAPVGTTWAPWACPASRPGYGPDVKIIAPKAGRHRGGERRHRRSGQRRLPRWPRPGAAVRWALRAVPTNAATPPKELGFDACIDYKAHNGDFTSLVWPRRSRTPAPTGIDGYFENVGGLDPGTP